MRELMILVRYICGSKPRVVDIQHAGIAIVEISKVMIRYLCWVCIAYIWMCIAYSVSIVSPVTPANIVYTILVGYVINIVSLVLVAAGILVMASREPIMLTMKRFGLALRIMIVVQLVNMAVSLLLTTVVASIIYLSI